MVSPEKEFYGGGSIQIKTDDEVPLQLACQAALACMEFHR